MSWDRVRDLYIDIRTAGGLATLLKEKTSNAAALPLVFVQGDKFTLRLFFRTPDESAGTSAVVQLPAGFVVAIGAKPAAMMGLSTLLFFEDTFAEAGSGDDIYYGATLDLNTTELAAALLASNSVDVTIDVEVQNSDNSERMTFQFGATIYRQSYSNEADPTPGTPTYPTPSTLLVKHCGTAAVTAAASSVTVTGLALDFTPAQVLVSIRKPAGGDNLWATVRDASISADGFIADLSAPAVGAGYKLDYLLIQE